ncbi:hypothetical protein GCM10007216_23530 [Thalassobacillus devorans]|uniref:Uncharacterized protein n=1 Tax=Thalassobacillus devorans TaxID=279813 RepID=A0ABQ1P6I0_9BACI|nr:hypothetical protein [Thalassobacillus devorans]NIK29694.1 hypothetical protein [Thalassobacillus devorans]GGC92083.1 hypothetical protein GCM10007216_23530 [Thalassobacillus devorans]
MENFINFLLNNIFLVAIFIGGIISWLNRMNTEQEEERPKRPPPQQKQTPARPVQPGMERMDRTERSQQKMPGENRVEKYYEEKKRQIKDISERNIGDRQDTGSFTYETPNRKIHDAIPGQMERTKPMQDGEKAATSLSIKSNLNRKKIAESVMMAEILGPPRAHKPHRTFSKRNNY